jgi:hypothetical protein
MSHRRTDPRHHGSQPAHEHCEHGRSRIDAFSLRTEWLRHPARDRLARPDLRGEICDPLAVREHGGARTGVVDCRGRAALQRRVVFEPPPTG